MSGIVLSSSVRQNLLSLQSTADLLATTQNRLSTGKKVNTALDNPTNFFTAQSLDSPRQRHQQPARRYRQRRAGAAGCQHRHHLALRSWSTPRSRSPTRRCRPRVGYSTKSNVSATIAGATATDLRGTTSFTSATALQQRAVSPARPAASPRHRCGTTLGGTLRRRWSATAADRRRRHCRQPSPSADPAQRRRRGATTICGQRRAVADGDTFTVNGKTITFKAGAAPAGGGGSAGSGVNAGNIVTDGNGNSTVYIGASRHLDRDGRRSCCGAIDLASGVR